MKYADFLSRVIEDGATSADEENPMIADGIRACRGLEPAELIGLCVRSKNSDAAENYRSGTAKTAGIEWVCLVVSIALTRSERPALFSEQLDDLETAESAQYLCDEIMGDETELEFDHRMVMYPLLLPPYTCSCNARFTSANELWAHRMGGRA